MILKMFTVYDSKSETYFKPIFMLTKGEALRAWIDLANDPQTQFCKYPGDFTMFEIGEFNDQNATFSVYESKINLGTALEHKKEEFQFSRRQGEVQHAQQ